jgi:hypothetical protein
VGQHEQNIQYVLDDAYDNLQFWVIADVSSHSCKPEKYYHFFPVVEKDLDPNVIISKIEPKAWESGAERIKIFEDITGKFHERSSATS